MIWSGVNGHSAGKCVSGRPVSRKAFGTARYE